MKSATVSLVSNPEVPSPATPFSCLQLGGGWFPEQSGGLNRFYYDLLHHLQGAGVRCLGVIAGTPDRWPVDDEVNVRAFASLRAPIIIRWRAERRLVTEELRREQYDLVAGHFAPYIFPVLGKVTASRPFVFHFHGPWALESRQEGGGRLACAAKASIERAVYRKAARLIVLSNAFKRILIDNYSIPPERIRVVPGGVDCDRFEIAESRAEARAKLGWPTDRPIVLSVRRLARRMGLENLIEAAEVVRRNVPNVLILIAGGGAQRERLGEVIRQRGLNETVRLLGFLPDAALPLAYRAADLTVVPTVALEGFGLVAAESLAAGTPALVTPVGGLVDLVGPLSNQLLFRGNAASDLAAGVTEALTGRSHLPDGVACAAYARQRFNWNIIAAAVADVYREAIHLG